MKTNLYGQPVFGEDDLVNYVMQGIDVSTVNNVLLDNTVNIDNVSKLIDNPNSMLSWQKEQSPSDSVTDWDTVQQQNWFMPEEYKQLDIAKHILDLCKTDAELQRVGEELLLYQEKELFDLLKYLKYLVDVMKENNIIWGVGRGSSVSSYVLYLLEVHRINSMYYDLDVHEFLR